MIISSGFDLKPELYKNPAQWYYLALSADSDKAALPGVALTAIPVCLELVRSTAASKVLFLNNGLCRADFVKTKV